MPATTQTRISRHQSTSLLVTKNIDSVAIVDCFPPPLNSSLTQIDGFRVGAMQSRHLTTLVLDVDGDVDLDSVTATFIELYERGTSTVITASVGATSADRLGRALQAMWGDDCESMYSRCVMTTYIFVNALTELVETQAQRPRLLTMHRLSYQCQPTTSTGFLTATSGQALRTLKIWTRAISPCWIGGGFIL